MKKLKSLQKALNLKKPSEKPAILYKPDLKLGVSAESPETFHLKFTKVLDSKAKNREISGKDHSPGVFLSDLKMNNVCMRSKFIYEDYSNQEAFSIDVLPLKEQIDLIQNEEERVRCRTPFYKRWKKQGETLEKFKISRGDFTVEANQLKITRNTTGKVQTLKNLLSRRKSTKKKNRFKAGVEPEVRFLTADKKMRRTKYLESDFNSANAFSQEIDYFENKLVLVPERKRWCYNLDCKK
jgi:hypothetical protein